MRVWGVLFLGAGALAATGACGTNTAVFSQPSGGAGGAAVGPGAGGAASTGSAGGGQGGASGPCTVDDDCAVDAPCIDAFCIDGGCSNPPSPAGTPCGHDQTCDGMGHCGLPLGEPCTEGEDCGSGFCVDGVCCDTSCEGECAACDVAGSEGICAPQPAGTDPDGECGGGSCDGSGSCASGEALWQKRFGDLAAQLGFDVAVDSAGNVIVAGTFAGTADFGGGALTSASLSDDVFVAKLDPAGNHLWSRRFGDAFADEGWRVAVDGNDNVVVTGHFQGSIDFGGGSLVSQGGFDVFVAKLDAMGDHLWSKRYGSSVNQFARGLDVRPGGNIAVTGFFQGSLDFGGGTLTTNGFYDVFVAVLDGAGNHVWSDSWGDGGDQRGYAVGFDASDNVFVTGSFDGTLDLGGNPLASSGSDDIFVAKLGANGSHQWSQRFGNAAAQDARDLAVDSAGNVIIVCTFSSAVDFGGGLIASAGATDACLAKLDGAGNHVFSAGYPGSSFDGSRAVTVDASDNIVFSGYAAGSIDLGGGTLPPGSGYDAFLAKLSPGGEHLWSHRYGAIGTQVGYGMKTNSQGEIYVTGYFEGIIDFGLMMPMTSGGQEDVFLAKLAP